MDLGLEYILSQEKKNSSGEGKTALPVLYIFFSNHAGELRVISLRGRKLSTSRGNDLLIPYNFLLYKKTERHY
jgi:hypothetical protein